MDEGGDPDHEAIPAPGLGHRRSGTSPNLKAMK